MLVVFRVWEWSFEDIEHALFRKIKSVQAGIKAVAILRDLGYEEQGGRERERGERQQQENTAILCAAIKISRGN